MEITNENFSIHFPTKSLKTLDQDEEYFLLDQEDKRERVRIHDYEILYSVPGLYEKLVYEELDCQSPQVVCGLLKREVKKVGADPTDLVVLDIGAGNGIVGEELSNIGVKTIVGIDIIDGAAQAVERDRPEIYDDYYVADLTQLLYEEEQALQKKGLNCLTSVAALGYDDIPVEAFASAFNLISNNNGWVAFCIKDKFLDGTDSTGFSGFIDELVKLKIMQIHEQTRYRHRKAINGDPLYYQAIIARKLKDIPKNMLCK